MSIETIAELKRKVDEFDRQLSYLGIISTAGEWVSEFEAGVRERLKEQRRFQKTLQAGQPRWYRADYESIELKRILGDKAEAGR
jgi:hypothetical protein